jgi:two-component system NtrC family sensor kinase
MSASKENPSSPKKNHPSADQSGRIEKLISELREHHEPFVQMEKMAALGQLVAGIAHEINTPLGAMISNNDSIKRAVSKLEMVIPDPGQPLSDEQSTTLAEFLNNIKDMNEVTSLAGDRILKIVSGLRSFARIDEANAEPANINEGLDSTLVLLQHHLKNRVEVHKNYGDFPDLICYPNQLNQVFMNVLVNASQAIEGKGDIFVRTWRDNDQVLVEIRDTGEGIAQENLDNIFEPGFTTKASGVGTGLGLAIVQQIINKHNGQVEVESQLGKGTTFRIILPIEQD